MCNVLKLCKCNLADLVLGSSCKLNFVIDVLKGENVEFIGLNWQTVIICIQFVSLNVS